MSSVISIKHQGIWANEYNHAAISTRNQGCKPSLFWQYMPVFTKTDYAPPSAPHGFRSPLPRPSPTQRSARHPVPCCSRTLKRCFQAKGLKSCKFIGGFNMFEPPKQTIHTGRAWASRVTEVLNRRETYIYIYIHIYIYIYKEKGDPIGTTPDRLVEPLTPWSLELYP